MTTTRTTGNGSPRKNPTLGGYERVTYRTPTGKCTVILHYIREGNGVLTGTECTKDGEIRWYGNAERKHLVALEYVTKRVPMVLDLVYGEMEEA